MAIKNSSPYSQFQVWRPEEIERDCERSSEQFVSGWASAAQARRADYEKHFAAARAEISVLFDATASLRDLRPGLLVRTPALLDALRFVAGPFVSADDMATLSGRSGATLSLEDAERVVAVVSAAVDSARFPWFLEKRAPSTAEVRSAMTATASVWATERFRTERRTQASSLQEAAVSQCLLDVGFKFAGKIPSEELKEGQFLKGRPLAGERCDVVARLFDQRWLAIECKVSNTAVNSYKRLNHDAVAKAKVWQTAYGKRYLVACAVLDGIFKPANVASAQNEHDIFIVWAHQLDVLARFVRSAKHSK